MDIVVVGSCMIDLVSTVPRLPKIGETVHGDTFSVGFGGKGANQCVMSARLGARTAMVGKVGDDTFGHDTLRNFTDNEVNSDHVGITKSASTGVATISVSNNGDNAIVIVAGANLELTEDNVLHAEHIISCCKVVICQLEIKASVTCAALKLAKKHGVRTILNMAPARSDVDNEIYLYSDIICLNESEAECITGLSVNSLQQADAACSVVLMKGCQCVILTLGAAGCVYMENKHPTQMIHVPTRTVQAVDTTGAGDAFIGALAFLLAAYPSGDMKSMLERANEIATLTVLKTGTQTSFMRSSDLPATLLTL